MIRALLRELAEARPPVFGVAHPSCKRIGDIDPGLIRTHPGLAKADSADFAKNELWIALENHWMYSHQSTRTTTGRAAEHLPYMATKRSVDEMAKTRVFKLQRPVATNDPEPKVLAYDQHRRFEFHLPLDGNLKQLFGDAYKVFVNATPKGQQLLVGQPVRARDW